MKSFYSWLFLLVALLLSVLSFPFSAIAAPRPSQTIALDGSWQFQPIARITVSPSSTPPDTWQSIHVPDNWFRQGKDINGQAWYKKSFSLTEAQRQQHAQLVFEGVDYIADVWLNGHYLGHHEGYFQTFEFDATPYLKPGHNELLVLVDSPLEAPEDWSFNKRLIKGVLSHHDTRPGGAWSERGQEQNTGGIWAPVKLVFSSQAALRMLTVTPRKEADHWRLQIDGIALSDVSHETTATLQAEIIPENFIGKSYSFQVPTPLKPGENVLSLSHDISDPQLWWPAEYGKSNLYRLKLSLVQDGKLLDIQEQVFGFREVRVDDGFRWHINGKRLFVRGTNYIGSQWLAELDNRRVSQDLRMMQDAHINAIRVHAHVSSPAFYEACDRMGFLVMQDFPLLWGYAEDETFLNNARLQAKDMVHLLRNHPSIVSWTMHNEPPWDAPWMAQKYPDYTPDRNLKLDNQLYKDVAALDDTRITRRESATKEHEWLGWYSGVWQDFARPAPTPWVTEFGAQALPALASLRHIFKEDELWPDNEEKWHKWEFHNFQPHETFDLAKVPMGNDIHAFIRNTQEYQARLIQYAVENYRRQRYAPIAAIFQFMFVEDWPSINWGIVDYWRQPKPGYAALQTAYQPILPSLEWVKTEYAEGEPIRIGLWVINDTWQDFPKAHYTVNLYQGSKRLGTLALPVEMSPDSGHKLRDYDLPALQAGTYQLEAVIQDQQQRIVGRNTFVLNVK